MLMRYRALRDVVTRTEVVSIVHHLGGGIGIRQISVEKILDHRRLSCFRVLESTHVKRLKRKQNLKEKSDVVGGVERREVT